MLNGIFTDSTNDESTVEMIVSLYNPEKTRVDVVVSLEKNLWSENYVVPVETGEIKDLKVDHLRELNNVFLIAMNAFFASYDVSSASRSHSAGTVQILPPMQKIEKGNSTFCQNYQKYLYVRNPINGVSARGLFKRSYFTDSVTCSNCSTLNGKLYIIKVYWPDSSTLHHDGTSHKEASCIRNYCCIKDRYATTVNTSDVTVKNVLFWRSDYSYFGIEVPSGMVKEIVTSFDNTLFDNGCGIAYCALTSSGGTFNQSTFCKVNPDFYWEIYSEESVCAF